MTSGHPHSAQHQLARARAVGSVLGPHTRTPRAQETGATGPGYLTDGRASGRGRAPNPRRPSQRRGGTPLGNPSPPPRRAMPNRARNPKGQCRVPTPAHPHPQHVGGGPQLLAPRTSSLERVRTKSQTPPMKARSAPPGMTTCQPHSAQRQLAGARALGPVPGPHTRSPRARETRATGPDCLPQGRTAGRGRAHIPRRPSQRREVPPRGEPLPIAWRTLPSRTRRPKAVRCRVPASAHPHAQQVGSETQLPAPCTGSRRRVPRGKQLGSTAGSGNALGLCAQKGVI